MHHTLFVHELNMQTDIFNYRKQSVRILNGNNYNAHREPMFKSYTILKGTHTISK